MLHGLKAHEGAKFDSYVFIVISGTLDVKTFGWFVVEPPTSLKNMSLSVGIMKFPVYGTIKNVPNHQPGTHL